MLARSSPGISNYRTASIMSSQGLLPDTREIIRTLEEASGYPVSFFEDTSLTVLATIRTGTQTSPIHVIRYRPGEQAPDYQIAVEVGYALRTFAMPPERRFHLSGDDDRRENVIAQTTALHPELDSSAAEALGNHLFNGLMLQLRSTPVGLLVDIWITSHYPRLRGLQAASLVKQVTDNAQSLSKEMENQYPRVIVEGNRAMNAAQAFFVADLLNQSQLAVPYRAAGLTSIATTLLAYVTRDRIAEIDDRDLITAWAQHLGIAAWVKWLPFN
jgi:hypothetical protein